MNQATPQTQVDKENGGAVSFSPVKFTLLLAMHADETRKALASPRPIRSICKGVTCDSRLPA